MLTKNILDCQRVMKKELSERKQKILQAVVDEYITTAEPVSSGEIKEKYLADISSDSGFPAWQFD